MIFLFSHKEQDHVTCRKMLVTEDILSSERRQIYRQVQHVLSHIWDLEEKRKAMKVKWASTKGLKAEGKREVGISGQQRKGIQPERACEIIIVKLTTEFSLYTQIKSKQTKKYKTKPQNKTN